MRFEGRATTFALRVTRRAPAILPRAGEFVLLRFGVRCLRLDHDATGEAGR
jgi:hypothetical protein